MGGQAIQSLKEAVESFVDNCDFSETALSLQTFGLSPEISMPLSTDEWSLRSIIASFGAHGGTPMGEAISRTISQIPLTGAVLISDGAPTDMDGGFDYKMHKDGVDYSVLEPYIEQEIKIDCIHISNSTSGENVMKHIAELTHGVFIKFKDVTSLTKNLKFLTPKYRALLTSGALLLEGADEVKF
jgi:hypothetical protein